MEAIPKNRQEWGRLEALLEEREPLSVRVEMEPATAQVREAMHLSFALSPVDGDWGAGTDVLVLVPRTWKLDLNGAFPEISKFFSVWQGGYGNGRECLVMADPVRPDGTASCELIPAGYEFLIHIRLAGVGVPAGERLRIHLAHPDGPRVRAPQTAQFHPFVTAVRPEDRDEFFPLSETPGVQTHGGPVRLFRVTGQAVIPLGESAQLKVVPMDRFELNRACDYGGEVTVVEPDGTERRVRIGQEETFARVEIPLSENRPFHYVQARDLDRGLIGRSHPVGHPDRFGGYRVFFGDLHSHCRPCDGFGTMEEAYAHAYDVSDLDFASVSHQQNSANFPFSDRHWEAYLEINERFNRKERFATLPICEHYSNYGHRHALFQDVEAARTFPVGVDYWGPPYDAANHPDRLWAHLEDVEALTFPHHMKFIRATDFSIPPSPMEPVMEVCSRWGISEVGGDHSAQYALSQGRRMGFIGGTDNQLGQPGSGTHGYNEGRGWTAVLTKSLDRFEIYDAIRLRRCYATTGAKMLLFFALGDHLMGEEVSGWTGDRTFEILAAGTGPIDRVEVVRNGEVVFTHRPEDEVAETLFCDEDPPEFCEPVFPGLVPFCYYYLRVTQQDRNQAWSSPIWISP